jgi:peroxin-14
LTAQYDAAETLLKEIQAETVAVRAAVDEQSGLVDKAVHNVEDACKEMREGEARTKDEVREIREEVNNIRDMIPTVG